MNRCWVYAGLVAPVLARPDLEQQIIGGVGRRIVALTRVVCRSLNEVRVNTAGLWLGVLLREPFNRTLRPECLVRLELPLSEHVFEQRPRRPVIDGPCHLAISLSGCVFRRS